MTDLLRTVEAESSAVTRFVALLKLEQAALSQGGVDDLVEFANQKSAVANELTLLANQRNTLLAAQGLAADRAGIETAIAGSIKRQPSDTALSRLWSQIILLASEAKELNRLNGELIQIRMQHNSQALEAMQGASRTLHLYGPDGQTTPLISRRINDAA
jgi:flagella synthesis protein FlgN